MADEPTSIDEIKKNAKMMAAYLTYAKRRQMLNEVMFYFDKGNAQGVYPKYIDPKSSTAANVSSAVLRPAEMLAAKADWGNKAWAKILSTGKAEVASALNDELAGGFCKSPEYRDFVIKEKMGDPTKAAKILGVDPKKLRGVMEARALGDTKAAKKLWEDIVKKDKDAMKYEEMMKALAKSGL